MENVQIITTADGSHSLINTTLNETYHSRHGAYQESLHVFISNGLDHFKRLHSPQEIRILEVGFGSGLNALLAMQWSKLSSTRVHYTGIEAFPLPETIWRKLNYSAWQESENDFYRLHELSWGVDHEVEPDFILRKEHAAVQEHIKSSVLADVVFYDAFAPDKQPEMWTPETLSRVLDGLVINGVIVTYCAKGELRRTLKNLGMKVESLPGAPGKKEMTRGTKTVVPEY